MAHHNHLGEWGEELAKRYLQQQGYVIIDSDWKSGHRDHFSEPLDAVNYRKMMNLRRAFNHYIKYHRVNNAVRFDIIGIIGSPEEGTPRIEHYKDVPVI